MDLQHLYRRAGFGIGPKDNLAGLNFETAVERLVGELTLPATTPAGFDPYEPGAACRAWLDRMLSGRARLAEKLSLFWHGHFATSNAKVGDMSLMWRQLETFRQLGGGSFQTLVKAVSRDPAMLLWLDGNSNLKSQPNENYARELMELFTLGVGHFTEAEVQRAARGFTGWSCWRGQFVFRPEHHDGSVPDGDEVISRLCRSARCSQFLAFKLVRFFAQSQPQPDYVERVAAAFRRSQGRMDQTLRCLFLDPAFQKSSKGLIKSPVEFLVAALLRAGITSAPDWVPQRLEAMGQALFYPPSVKGWEGGAAWLSAGPFMERLHLAAELDARLAEPEFQLN